MSGQFHALATLLPEEVAPGTHYREDWAAPRAGLDVIEKRNISFPYPELNPGYSDV